MAKKIENMIEELEARERVLKGSSALGAPSLLSFPWYNDSARMIMFNSHMKQRVVLNHTEFPKVFGNFENMVGENSGYNQRAEHNFEVVDIIEKFPNIPTAKEVQCILYIVHDLDSDKYDIIEVNDVEDMTEKYGFQYDNSGIKQFKKGDRIKKDTPLMRPTSYDEYNNYGFGKNIKFMYMVNQDTIEDAIVVSESLAKLMESTEVEEVKVPINDNDFLGNFYGDAEVYKSFPDVGESTRDKVFCVKKRINTKQILYDLKSSNVRKILNSDTPYYIEGTVSDIDIHFNKKLEELNTAQFNEQLNYYVEVIYDFYLRVKASTQRLIDMDISKCTDALLYWNKRVTELMDPDYKKRDELGNTPSNMIMYVKTKRPVGLYTGQKLTGRYGNKGVISRVVPDYLMPHLETGEIVHIIFNTLGVYNRLNIFQLYEQSINFITEKIVARFIDEDCSIEEMERDTFKVLGIFNKEEQERIYAAYKKTATTKAKKKEFFDIIKKNGIFIHIKPYWHSENVYESVCKCYEEFPWIEPYKVYFYEPVSKRWTKMMNDQVIGSMYVMKLKQSSKKNMSSCSTAPINNLGLPEKTDAAKKHRSLYPKTPIRSGLQETLNNMISIDPKLSAKLHLYYRSSPVAREQLGLEIVTNYGKGLPIEPVLTDKMTNRNVEVLSSRLMIMGCELENDVDEVYLPTTEEGRKSTKAFAHKYHGQTYLMTPEQMLEEVARNEVRKKMDNNELGYIYIGHDGEDKDRVVDELVEQLEEDIVEGPSRYFQEEGDIMY